MKVKIDIYGEYDIFVSFSAIIQTNGFYYIHAGISYNTPYSITRLFDFPRHELYKFCYSTLWSLIHCFVHLSPTANWIYGCVFL